MRECPQVGRRLDKTVRMADETMRMRVLTVMLAEEY
jgi:hypothetical protein